MVRSKASREKAREDFDSLRERMSDPLLTALTVALATWMFVLAPLREDSARGADVVGLLIALAVAGALLVLSGKITSVVLMLFGLTLSAASAWFRLHDPSSFDIVLNALAWIIMGLVLIWVVGHAVFAPGRITYHRIMGAILLYLAIGLTFAALYALVGIVYPDAFAGMQIKDSPTFSSTMIYFSFGTLTTAGSGDIAPIHPVARSLVNLQAMIGQLYPATLLARLVTLEIEDEGKG